MEVPSWKAMHFGNFITHVSSAGDWKQVQHLMVLKWHQTKLTSNKQMQKVAARLPAISIKKKKEMCYWFFLKKIDLDDTCKHLLVDWQISVTVHAWCFVKNFPSYEITEI